MDNNVCPDCGTNNDIKSKFCINCGKQLINVNNSNSVQDNNQVNIDNDSENKEAKMLGTISLLLYFAGSAIVSFLLLYLPTNLRNSFSTLSGLCPLIGIVVMVIGRVKYPNNKYLKTVMWVIIISIILALIAFIIFAIWCYITCSNMDTSGCG